MLSSFFLLSSFLVSGSFASPLHLFGSSSTTNSASQKCTPDFGGWAQQFASSQFVTTEGGFVSGAKLGFAGDNANESFYFFNPAREGSNIYTIKPNADSHLAVTGSRHEITLETANKEEDQLWTIECETCPSKGSDADTCTIRSVEHHGQCLTRNNKEMLLSKCELNTNKGSEGKPIDHQRFSFARTPGAQGHDELSSASPASPSVSAPSSAPKCLPDFRGHGQHFASSQYAVPDGKWVAGTEIGFSAKTPISESVFFFEPLETGSKYYSIKAKADRKLALTLTPGTKATLAVYEEEHSQLWELECEDCPTDQVREPNADICRFKSVGYPGQCLTRDADGMGVNLGLAECGWNPAQPGKPLNGQRYSFFRDFSVGASSSAVASATKVPASSASLPTPSASPICLPDFKGVSQRLAVSHWVLPSEGEFVAGAKLVFTGSDDDLKPKGVYDFTKVRSDAPFDKNEVYTIRPKVNSAVGFTASSKGVSLEEVNAKNLPYQNWVLHCNLCPGPDVWNSTNADNCRFESQGISGQCLTRNGKDMGMSDCLPVGSSDSQRFSLFNNQQERPSVSSSAVGPASTSNGYAYGTEKGRLAGASAGVLDAQGEANVLAASATKDKDDDKSDDKDKDDREDMEAELLRNGRIAMGLLGAVLLAVIALILLTVVRRGGKPAKSSTRSMENKPLTMHAEGPSAGRYSD